MLNIVDLPPEIIKSILLWIPLKTDLLSCFLTHSAFHVFNLKERAQLRGASKLIPKIMFPVQSMFYVQKWEPRQLQRILIIGSMGSGKTEAIKDLRNKISGPCNVLDHLDFRQRVNSKKLEKCLLESGINVLCTADDIRTIHPPLCRKFSTFFLMPQTPGLSFSVLVKNIFNFTCLPITTLSNIVFRAYWPFCVVLHYRPEIEQLWPYFWVIETHQRNWITRHISFA